MDNIKQLLEALAPSFSEVSRNNRELEDHCVYKEDKERARLRSLICADIADGFRNAHKFLKNEK